MNDLVSVIITTYKRQPELIVRAINSVLSQTYKNIEVIVVDDSPADYEYRGEVKKAVESLNERVGYIQHKENMGACAARNTGINSAKGDFVAFLDDDDEWLPDKLEKQMTAFLNEDIGLVYCSYYVVDEELGDTHVRNADQYTGYIYDKLIFENFIGSTSCVVLRKSVVKEVGLFDVKMKASQDYDVWLRISSKYKVEALNEPLLRYYVHNGECISFNPKNKIQGYERLIEKNAGYLKEHKDAMSKRQADLSAMYAWDGQYSKAFKLLSEAVLSRPFAVKDNLGYIKTSCGYLRRRIRENR